MPLIFWKTLFHLNSSISILFDTFHWRSFSLPFPIPIILQRTLFFVTVLEVSFLLFFDLLLYDAEVAAMPFSCHSLMRYFHVHYRCKVSSIFLLPQPSASFACCDDEVALANVNPGIFQTKGQPTKMKSDLNGWSVSISEVCWLPIVSVLLSLDTVYDRHKGERSGDGLWNGFGDGILKYSKLNRF